VLTSNQNEQIKLLNSARSNQNDKSMTLNETQTNRVASSRTPSLSPVRTLVNQQPTLIRNEKSLDAEDFSTRSSRKSKQIEVKKLSFSSSSSTSSSSSDLSKEMEKRSFRSPDTKGNASKSERAKSTSTYSDSPRKISNKKDASISKVNSSKNEVYDDDFEASFRSKSSS
jgi:hypothetical protein